MKYFIIVTLFFSLATSNAYTNVNHAPLGPKHVHVAENFVNRHFKLNGIFNAPKILQFIERLENEKISLVEDLYETKLIEKLELEIKDLKKAKKSALKELDEEKNKLAKGYNIFLIPLAKEIHEATVNGTPEKVIEGLADRFIELYASYFIPELGRGPVDSDIINQIIVFRNELGYRFKKNSDKYVEANNLEVGDHHEAVFSCLQYSVNEKHILLDRELKRLKHCGFDLSLLEPVKNPLLKKHNENSLSEAKNIHIDWFPTEDDDLKLNKFKFSGVGSPKINATFKRNGKKNKVKIKIGRETHSDTATSMLGRIAGFNQDHMITRHMVKLNLGKTSYKEFVVTWKRKYNGYAQGDVATHVYAHSTPEEKKQWVILKDAAFEVKHPEKIRLGEYHPVAWDLPNRREHRALILWYSWLNLDDARMANHKVLLKKTKNGYETEYSMQDVGRSLRGMGVDIRNIRDYLENNQLSSVNGFPKSALSWSDKSIHLWWNEGCNNFHMRKFKTTTYSDLKWMARRIAQIKREDIKYALEVGGYPAEVADLYLHKLSNRRNELIKAFDLEDEYELFEVPDLDHYSPNDLVKNGKIVVSAFDNHSGHEQTYRPLIQRIFSAVDSRFPNDILGKNITTQLGNQTSAHFNGDIKLWDGKQTKNFTYSAVRSNIGIRFDRTVMSNRQDVNYNNNNTQAFVVRDKITLRFYIGSGAVKKIAKDFPINFSAGLNVWTREYEHVHFANSWIEGYKRPFKTWKFLKNFNQRIVQDLTAGELFKISDSYGFNVSGSTLIPSASNISATAGVRLSWLKASPVYFMRDSFGQFIIYKEKGNQFSSELNLDMGLTGIIDTLPIIGLSIGISPIGYKSELYSFKLPEYSIEQTALDQYQRKSEEKALRELLESGYNSIPALARREFTTKASVKVKHANFKFLFFFKNNNDFGHSKIVVELADGSKRNFHRAFIKNAFEISDPIVHPKIDELGVFKRDSYKISVEADQDDLSTMTALIELKDYKFKLRRKKLLKYIDSLNESYSEDNNKPFFRNFVIPDSEEVKNFYHLESHIRVFVNAGSFLKKMRTYSKSDLRKIRQLFKKYFNDHNDRRRSRHESVYEMDEPRYEIAYRKFKSYYGKVLEHKENPQKLTKYFAKMLKVFKIHRNGMELFKKLIGKDNTFVMGEIYKLYNHFSPLEQTEESTRERRFAGKSWGSYVHIPPVRAFLKNHRLAPVSIYAQTGDRDDPNSFFSLIFGVLPEV